jgi:hypothetical protein
MSDQPSMTGIVSPDTVRQAIEVSLWPGIQCIYLSHPLTTGGRSISENTARAAALAEELRRTRAQPVVNPTHLGPIPGWTHATYMDLWLPFIRERVAVMVVAPDWESSKGCVLEVEQARALRISVFSPSGFPAGPGRWRWRGQGSP